MKILSVLAFACLFAISATAQQATPANQVKFPAVDASPADILYYPLNAAKVKKEDTSVPVMKVIYSRPQKKGREIFGVMEKYGSVWRLGANESTEITFNKEVTIGGKKIPTGTYSLFAIPTKDNWTVIVNRKIDRWGAFSYEEAKDVVRVTVPVQSLNTVVEAFSMTFTDSADGANLVMAWDKTQATLPIKFVK